ncbi:helix-turn-helix domain-containing protein [Amycolatopsis saalfeldensis]|uniref:helix-turn-helix domain-containing protein n=1 Tax=Amycolatopsis saalfeldensis TaxID=394193 RepID=UPI003CCB8363
MPPSASSRYLGEDDRVHIADRLREQATIRQIAAELGRSPSTISREIPPQPPPRQRAVPATRRAGPCRHPPAAAQDLHARGRCRALPGRAGPSSP